MTLDWVRRKLGEAISLEYGKPLPKEKRCSDGAYPAYGANGIKCHAIEPYWEKPSIIVGRKGSAGAINLVDGGFWPLDVTYYVTFDEQQYDLKYLFYMLSCLNLPLLAKGVKPGINRNDVYSIEQLFPPLPKQKRIVAILDEAFAGIATAVANTEKNLANARALFKNTVVARVFGDPDKKGWQAVTVEELARSGRGSIRTGPFGSQLLHGEFVDEGVAVLGIDNAVKNEFAWGKRRYITKEKYKELERYTVRPRDVLITIMGTCGRCAVVPIDIPLAINTKHLCCISLDKERCIPDFLHA